MKKNNIKVYTLGLFLLAILFFAVLVLNKMTYIIFSIILLTFAIITKYTLKKKKILSIYESQVIWILIAFAIIYLGIFYLLGVIEYDFYRSSVLFSLKTLYRFIIPLTLIIISSEVIRYRFLSQSAKIRILKKRIDLSKAIIFISMVLIDLIIYVGVYDLTNYDDFLTVLGFILFASISCNLLYNYISVRYGIKGIVAYRMITILYVYIIPFVPDIYVYFQTFIRMLYPYFLYLVFEKIFSNNEFAVAHVERRKNVIAISFIIIIMTLITMLISCQFKYGILVIGSGSMTGTINIGDGVIYEQYKNQKIENGTIIIFERNGIKLVHRVIKIKSVDNQIRYYTKGDANKEMDTGYVTSKDIVGITKLRVMYVGYPTLWIRALFS